MINHQFEKKSKKNNQLQNIRIKIFYQLKRFGFFIQSTYKKSLVSVTRYIQRRRKKMSQKIRRVGKERVYILKGYTTVAKINQKRHAENQQRFLRKFLFIIIAFLILTLLFTIYNPFKDLSELYRIIGIKDFSDLTQTINIDDQKETTSQMTENSKIIIKTSETIDG